jgi:hypothetical protein
VLGLTSRSRLQGCTGQHDGTCTGVLARSDTRPDELVMRLVCESCNEVVSVLGSLEHTVSPVLQAHTQISHVA